MISTSDLAWVAGIVEGEGSFTPMTKPGHTPSPRIVVHMTDRDIIERLARFWGCAVKMRTKPRESHWKQQYKAQVNGARAWLGVRRREQARLLLVRWKDSPRGFRYRTHCPQGHPYSGANLRIEHRATGNARRCRICGHAAVRRWEQRRREAST